MNRRALSARLIGGPCDGELVKVLGIRWEKPVSYDFKTRRGKKAVYRWDYLKGEVVGRFVGLRRWL